MKKPVLSFICLLLFTTAYSQKINYQNNYQGALAKAIKEKKLLFVVIATPTIVPPANFKVSHTYGIDDAEVIELYNKKFINYQVLFTDSASIRFRRKYQISRYPTYLFIDGHENLVYRESDNSSSPAKYTIMAKKALAIVSSGKTLSSYEKKYQKNNSSAAFLKEYISLREDLGIYNNADLIDEYVDQLTIKSFQNYDEVLFILKAGPYAYGKAYNLCYANRKIVDSIYKKEALDLRSAINNRIIGNTMAEAISKKNAALARQAASYTSGTWQKDFKRANREMSLKMLYYYQAVKDTASYYQQAIYFYDANYLNIPADSAKRMSKTQQEAFKKSIMSMHKPDTARYKTMRVDSGSHKKIYVSEAVLSNSGSDVANVLNNAAYEFYALGTHNQNYLIKALIWSKRSIELNPLVDGYYDTLAHLLYRLGFFAEAASAQDKAVNLALENRMASKGYVEHLKAELNKIKEHTI